MSYFPLNWHKINVIDGGYTPSTIKKYNNAAFQFWERALFQRAASVILAHTPWDGAVKDFFTWCLYRRGYVAIWDDEKYGICFQPCTLAGYDFYYQPTRAIIANPVYKGPTERWIGSDCEILKLTPDYMGIWDIINYHAEKLALLDNAINMSIINNKFSFILGAKNKAMASALKKIIDLVNEGNPAVIYDKRMFSEIRGEEPWQFLERPNLKNSYITDLQLQDMHTILNDFDNQIGIPTIPYEKKERLVTDEANSKVIESQSRCQIWVECLNESAEIINDRYGTDLFFELRYEPDLFVGTDEEEEEIDDGDSENNTSGA